MRAIFQSLPGLIDELPADEVRKAIVFAILSTVLGEHLRERCSPLDYGDGTLFVAVTDAEWKREFKQHAKDIVFKLNRAFGRSLVQRIEPVVDAKAVKHSRVIRGRTAKTAGDFHSISPDIQKASRKIADTDLRSHFVQAVAVCIELRDGK